MSLPGHDDYRRPPFSAARIRRGVDLCRVALAEAKALREGSDPDEAADIAEGEAAARRGITDRACRHCKAAPGRPCVRIGVPVGVDGEMTGYHPCRTEDYLASLEAA